MSQSWRAVGISLLVVCGLVGQAQAVDRIPDVGFTEFDVGEILSPAKLRLATGLSARRRLVLPSDDPSKGGEAPEGLDAPGILSNVRAAGERALGYPVRVTQLVIVNGNFIGKKPRSLWHVDRQRVGALVVPFPGATGVFFTRGMSPGVLRGLTHAKDSVHQPEILDHVTRDPGSVFQAQGASIHGGRAPHRHGAGPRLRAVYQKR